MFRLLLSTLVLSFIFACTPKRIAEASSTVEDEPNQPVAAVDAGVAPVVEAPSPVAAPPAPTLTLVKVDAPEGFSVMLPENPQIQRGQTPMGKKVVNSVSMWATVDNVTYSVKRDDYPETKVKKAGPAKMLGDLRTGLATQFKGTINDEQDLELAGSPGQRFTVAGATAMVRVRTGLVNSQLYTLAVVYAGAVPAKAEEFLNSLQIAGPAPVRAAPAPEPAAAPAPAPAPAK